MPEDKTLDQATETQSPELLRARNFLDYGDPDITVEKFLDRAAGSPGLGGYIKSPIGQFVRGASGTAAEGPKAVGIIAAEYNRRGLPLSGDIIPTGRDVTDPKQFTSYKVGEAIDAVGEALAPDLAPALRESWIFSKIPRGLGSVAGFMFQAATGTLPARLGLKIAQRKIARDLVKRGVEKAARREIVTKSLEQGMKGATGLVVGLSGALTNASSSYHRAIAEGATPDQAWDVFVSNGLVGVSEAIPISNFINRIDKVTGGKLKTSIIKAAAETTAETFEEFIQEALQSFAEDLSASAYYDPSINLTQALKESMGAGGEGGAVGFTASLLTQILTRGRAGGKGTEPTAAPEKPTGTPIPPTAAPEKPTGAPETVEPITLTGEQAQGIREEQAQMTEEEVTTAAATAPIPGEPTPLAEATAPAASQALKQARLDAAAEVKAKAKQKEGEIDEGTEERQMLQEERRDEGQPGGVPEGQQEGQEVAAEPPTPTPAKPAKKEGETKPTQAAPQAPKAPEAAVEQPAPPEAPTAAEEEAAAPARVEDQDVWAQQNKPEITPEQLQTMPAGEVAAKAKSLGLSPTGLANAIGYHATEEQLNALEASLPEAERQGAERRAELGAEFSAAVKAGDTAAQARIVAEIQDTGLRPQLIREAVEYARGEGSALTAAGPTYKPSRPRTAQAPAIDLQADQDEVTANFLVGQYGSVNAAIAAAEQAQASQVVDDRNPLSKPGVLAALRKLREETLTERTEDATATEPTAGAPTTGRPPVVEPTGQPGTGTAEDVGAVTPGLPTPPAVPGQPSGIATGTGETGRGGGRPVQPTGPVEPEPTVPTAPTEPGVATEPRGAEASSGVQVTDDGTTVEPGTGETPASESKPATDPANQDHVIEPGDELAPNGVVAKIRANIAAIKLLKQLEAEERNPTPEEKQVLAKYAGWGALKQVFDAIKGDASRVYEDQGWMPTGFDTNWHKRFYPHQKALRDLLTEEEYESAAASTLNAHYTARNVVNAIWKIVERIGFTKGTIMEPGSGIGNMLGLAPPAFRGNRKVAIERDDLTGRMLTKLYPQTKVFVDDIAKVKIPPASVDLVVANVPFGENAPADPAYKGRPFNLHNYFISKILDTLRPGGVGVIITSSNTMEAQAAQRQKLAERAELLGAMRLPNTAFKENAGTEVTTDILIIRKPVGNAVKGNAWTEIVPTKTYNGEDTTVNEYYAEHPEMVLGKLSNEGTQYRKGEKAVLPDGDLDAQLDEAIARLPENAILIGDDTSIFDFSKLGEAKGIKEGTILEREGKLVIVQDGKFVDAATVEPKLKSAKRQAQARRFVKVKELYRRLIDAQLNPELSDEEIEGIRKEVNTAYDDYVSRYGFVTEHAVTLFGIDLDSYLVEGMERGEKYIKDNGRTGIHYVKSPIMEKRTNSPAVPPARVDTTKDASAVSLSFRGQIDVPFMAQLTGKTTGEVETDLAEQDIAYLDPRSGQWVPKAQYLAGNVVVKQEEAAAAAESDPMFNRNVEALKAVRPELKPIDRIDFALGTPWVPVTVVRNWLGSLGFGGRAMAGVRYVKELDKWYIPRGEPSGGASTQGMRTSRRGFFAILEKVLNNRKIEVWDPNPDGSRTFNERATLEARLAADRMRAAFESWVKSDADASTAVEDVFNRQFNSQVTPSYEVDRLDLPGMSSETPPLRQNQKNAIYRLVQKGYGLLAHVVGAGKTMAMIASAMEMRRLGIAKKPMIAVYNPTLQQFAETARLMYPNARVLVATKDDLKPAKRRRFLAKIVAGEFDLIIIAQSSFNMLPNDPTREAAFIMRQISELRESIREARREAGQKDPSVRDVQKEIDRLTAKLADLAERHTEDVIYFEQLGIDQLFIDEAHFYKKPPFVTKMGNISGLDKSTSDRAYALLLKIRYIQSIRKGKGIVLATGTPVTNTLGEAWHMLNFTNPELLRDMGVDTFDRFVGQFVRVEDVLSTNAAGQMVNKSKLARYVNGNELIRLIRDSWDIVSSDMLKPILEASGQQLPEWEGGKIQTVVVPLTDSMERLQRWIVDVLEQYQQLSGEARKFYSWVPVQLFQIQKFAAVDMRLIDPNAPYDPNGKIAKAVHNVVSIYRQVENQKGAQVVFLDTFAPYNTSKVTEFSENGSIDLSDLDENPNKGNVQKASDAQAEIDDHSSEAPGADFSSDPLFLFKDIKAKLVEAGIPESEIYIFNSLKDTTSAETALVLEKVNSGEIRVLLGSRKKMGTGVNIQERLAAVHHLDTPWTPAELEQANGRAIRAGNLFQEVKGFYYGMAESIDAGLAVLMEYKSKFFWQLMAGEGDFSTFEDPSSEIIMSAQEQIAQLSGDPLQLERTQLQQRVRLLNIGREADQDARAAARRQIQFFANQNNDLKAKIVKLQEQMDALQRLFPPDTALTAEIDGKTLTERKDIVAALAVKIQARFEEIIQGRQEKRWEVDRGGYSDLGPFGKLDLGSINGVQLTMNLAAKDVLRQKADGTGVEMATEVTSLGVEGQIPGVEAPYSTNAGTGEGVVRQMTASAKETANNIDKLTGQIANNNAEAKGYQDNLDKPWPKEAEWRKATDRLQEVVRLLTGTATPPTEGAPGEKIGEAPTITAPEAAKTDPADEIETIQRLDVQGLADYNPRTERGLHAQIQKIRQTLAEMDRRERATTFGDRLKTRMHQLEQMALDQAWKAAKDEVRAAWKATQTGTVLMGPPLLPEHFRLYRSLFNLALFWARRQINPALRTVQNFAAWAKIKINRAVQVAFEDAMTGVPRNKIEDLPEDARKALAGMDMPNMPEEALKQERPPEGQPEIPSWVQGSARRKLSTALGWIKDPEFIYRTETEKGRDESAARLLEAFGNNLELALRWLNQANMLVGLPDSLRAVAAGKVATAARDRWLEVPDPVLRKKLEGIQREAVNLAKQILSAQGQGLQAAKQVEHMMGDIFLEEYREMLRFKQERAMRGRWSEIAQHEVRWWLHTSAREAVKKLDQTFNKATVLMRRWLKSEVKDMGTTFRKIFEDAIAVQGDIRRELYQRLLEVPDFARLSPEQQLDLANLFLDAWQKEHLVIFKREFNKRIKDPTVREEDKNKAKRRAPQLVRWANLGLLDNEAFRDSIAPEYDVKQFSEETARKLTRMAQEAQALPEGSPRSTAYQELFRTLTREADVKFREIGKWIGSWWYASVLSGLSTQGRNIWGNSAMMMDNFLTYSVRDPMGVIRGIGDVLAWMRDSAVNPAAGASPIAGILRGLQKSMQRETTAIMQGEFPALSAGTRKVEVAMGVLEAWSTSERLWQRLLANGRYVTRFMSAMDSVFYNANWEMAAGWEARKLGRDIGLTGTELDRFISDRLLTSPESRQAARDQAEAEILAGLGTEKNKDRRVNEILRQNQAEEWPEWIERLNYMSLEATLNNDPDGVLGSLAKHLIQWRNRYPIITPILPFIRIGANVGNQLLLHSPLGLYSVAINYPHLPELVHRINNPALRDLMQDAVAAMRKGPMARQRVQMNEEMWQQMRARVLLSHVAAIGLATLAASYLDDDDPPFQITGTFGGLTKAQRQQLKDQGIFQYQIRIGGIGITYRETPYASFLAMIGNYMDALRYGTDDRQKEAVSLLASSWYGGYGAMLDQSFLTGLMAFVDRPSFSMEAENWWRKILFQVARTATGVIPRAFKDVSVIAEETIGDPTLKESQTLMNYITREIPIARWTLPDRLNALGETIPEPSPAVNWLLRYRQNAGPAWEILGKKAQSGVYMPMVGKTAKILVNGERRMMNDLEFREYARIYGQLAKAEIERNASALDAMSPERTALWFKSRLAPLKERAQRQVQAQARRTALSQSPSPVPAR